MSNASFPEMGMFFGGFILFVEIVCIIASPGIDNVSTNWYGTAALAFIALTLFMVSFCFYKRDLRRRRNRNEH